MSLQAIYGHIKIRNHLKSNMIYCVNGCVNEKNDGGKAPILLSFFIDGTLRIPSVALE